MTTDFEGPSLLHGREINCCVKCRWLKSRLNKSGRNPDYEFYCMHPDILAGVSRNAQQVQFLEKIMEKYPDKVDYFIKTFSDRDIEIKKHGQFISNDSYGTETPGWCPIVKQKADEAGKE